MTATDIPTPTTGQSAPRLPASHFAEKPLNAKETSVLDALTRVLSRGIAAHETDRLTLAELAERCFPRAGDKASSWVRNSLRRLVRGGFVKKLESRKKATSASGADLGEKAVKAADLMRVTCSGTSQVPSMVASELRNALTIITLASPRPLIEDNGRDSVRYNAGIARILAIADAFDGKR